MVGGITEIRHVPTVRRVGRPRSRISPKTLHIHRDTYHIAVNKTPPDSPRLAYPPSWLRAPDRGFTKPYTKTQRVILFLDSLRPLVHWMGAAVVFLLTRVTFANVYSWSDRK